MTAQLERPAAPNPPADPAAAASPGASGPAPGGPGAPDRRWGRPGVELSADRAFAGRIRRLARTAVVALGLIWLAAVGTGVAGPVIGAGLLAGWVLMPALLWLSLARPRLRYALVLPSALVSFSLLAICLSALPDDRLASAGWLLMAGGILLGGLLGFWFWFRWLPVPAVLDAPFAPGRWWLIGLHVAAIVGGLGLVAAAWWW